MPPRRKHQSQQHENLIAPGQPIDESQKVALLEILFAEIDKSVESRCSSILAATEEAVQVLRTEHRIQRLKLPKVVQQMPLTEFKEKYGGQLEGVILEDINRRMASHLGSASALTTPAVSRDVSEGPGRTVLRTRAKRVRGGSVATGSDQEVTGRAHDSEGAAAPPVPLMTAARAPRPGEVLYSVKGSPLAQVESDSPAEGAPPLPGGGLPIFTPATRAATRSRAFTNQQPQAAPALAPPAPTEPPAPAPAPAPATLPAAPPATFVLATAAPARRARRRAGGAAAAEEATELRTATGAVIGLEGAPEHVRQAAQLLQEYAARKQQDA